MTGKQRIFFETFLKKQTNLDASSQSIIQGKETISMDIVPYCQRQHPKLLHSQVCNHKTILCCVMTEMLSHDLINIIQHDVNPLQTTV